MSETTLYDVRCVLNEREWLEYNCLCSMARTGLSMSFQNYKRLENYDRLIEERVAEHRTQQTEVK